MSTFLHDLASRLIAQHGTDLSKVCVVLPGRRAGVFFRKALGDCTDKAIWAPTVRSIEDFVTEGSGLTLLDKTTLLFRFFEVYRQHADDPQPIAQFAAWAGSFLADINEIDLNMLNAEAVFHDLHSVERIARWNPDGSPPSDFQKRHLEFVRQFPVFYSELKKSLLGNREGYQGIAFRKVAEEVERDIATSPWDKVVFAGFNALTVSEETIMQAWLQSGKAQLLWDMDSTYVNDPIHEAGHYMRKYLAGQSVLRLEKEWEWSRPWLTEGSKQVDIIVVQRKVSQAKVAASLIAKRLEGDPEANFQRTAIVLNDEQLLMPLLHALPAELKGINITMGYGLQFSQSAVFINKLFKLWQNSADHDGKLYHHDLAAIYTDTFYLAATGHRADELLKRLADRRKVSIRPAEAGGDHIIERIILLEMDGTPQGFLNGLEKLIVTVRETCGEIPALSLEMEFLHRLGKMMTRLGDMLRQYPEINDLRTLHVFWRQLLRGVQLDFKGEPLTGLQVMGMLETRNLDFEEVIMLGVNEGNLPSGASSSSYLTYDIRGSYGLARQNERDAVTAYHFYRLLHRAQQVTLIYDGDTDAMGKGEVSRYVHQLRLEQGANIRIREFEVKQEVKSSAFRPTIVIRKGEREMERLVAHAARGFSPSALNSYRNCALRFYFRYVAGFSEQNDLSEHIAHDTFGSAVHNTLEHLYTPLIGRPLTVDALEALRPQVNTELDRQFREVLALDEPPEGRNLLALEVARTYVHRVISHDIKTLRSGTGITLLQLEEQLEAVLHINDTEVLLKGMADRIDRLSDGTVRIIDYKTGAKPQKSKVEDPEEFDGSGLDHFFQLLMYALMYASEDADAVMHPLLFYVRHEEMEKPLKVLADKAEVSGTGLLDYASARISTVVRELLDPEQPFTQTDDAERCKHCDFNGICQR
jgi:ATP-dependent helicase/nuclease subunit B